MVVEGQRLRFERRTRSFDAKKSQPTTRRRALPNMTGWSDKDREYYKLYGLTPKQREKMKNENERRYDIQSEK